VKPLTRFLQNREKRTQAARSGIGILLLGLFVSILVLSDSVGLHTALHANAASPGHHCAVTLLSSGQVEAASVTTIAPPAPVIAVAFLISMPSVQTVSSFNLPLSRGPPALLS
jgi:hypothetical protein